MEGFKEFINEKPINASDSDVVHLYRLNKKIEEIAMETGRSVGNIYRTLKSNHITPNRLKTNHQYVDYYHNAGFGIPQIAQLTGYSERNVRYILNKLTD